MAVVCYWLVALVLAVAYAMRFNPSTAKKWAYSCMSGWAFTWLVLEIVKVTLSTILELSQLGQRKRMHDYTKLKDKVAAKKAAKMKQMLAMATRDGIPVPKLHPLLPVPPLPPEPPPALGDASAG